MVTGVGNESYERFDLLPIALASYARQTYKNKELCVVYGGSLTYKNFVEKLLSQFSNVNRVYQKDFLPLGLLRNMTLDLITGDVLMPFDDDDDYHNQSIEFQLNHLVMNDIDANVYANILYTLLDKKKTKLISYSEREQWFAGNTLMAFYDKNIRYIESGNRDVSEFRKHYVSECIFEDTHFANAYIKENQQKIIDSIPYFNYILHGNNLTLGNNWELHQDIVKSFGKETINFTKHLSGFNQQYLFN